MKRRNLARFLSLASILALASCDEDGTVSLDDVNRFCEASCSKYDSCGTLMGFLTRDECVTRCVSPGDDGMGVEGPTCEVSDSQINACLSALESASCDAINGGQFPTECDVCPEDEDAGTSDAGMSMLAAECSALQTCCDSLAGPERGACEAIVGMNRGSVCSAAAPTYCMSADAGTTDTGTADTGAPDTGTMDSGIEDTGTTDSGSSANACDDLAACCVQLSAQIRPSCEAVVQAGLEAACQMALDTFRTGNLCE